MTVKKSADMSTSPPNSEELEKVIEIILKEAREIVAKEYEDDTIPKHEVETGLIVSVSADGKLELPPELQAQLEPFARYEVFMANNKIVLKKIPKSSAWLALSTRIEAEGDDLEQPSLKEITEIVKETRRLHRATTE